MPDTPPTPLEMPPETPNEVPAHAPVEMPPGNLPEPDRAASDEERLGAAP